MEIAVVEGRTNLTTTFLILACQIPTDFTSSIAPKFVSVCSSCHTDIFWNIQYRSSLPLREDVLVTVKYRRSTSLCKGGCFTFSNHSNSLSLTSTTRKWIAPTDFEVQRHNLSLGRTAKYCWWVNIDRTYWPSHTVNMYGQSRNNYPDISEADAKHR